MSINLSQSNPERPGNRKNSLFDKSTVVSVVLLIAAFGSLLGVKLYGFFLDKKIEAVNKTITAQLTDIENDSVGRLIDFQERLTSIKTKLVSKDISSQEMFATVEKLMVTGASLDSYEYDSENKKLSLTIVTADFRIVAQQAMSLKSFAAFTNVAVESTSRGTDGSVVSDVIISL